MFLIEPGSELTTSCIRVLILGFSFYSVWVKNDKKTHTHTQYDNHYCLTPFKFN